MYRFINESAYTLLQTFNGSSVQRYFGTLSENRDKRDFKSFYGMNAARLSDSFCNAYFELLDSKKINGKSITFNAENASEDAILIADYLETIPCNNKGDHKIHFSFATKLLHTISQNCPIYDSRIADFYFFPYIAPSVSKEQKLSRYKKCYEFLIAEYKRIKAENLLSGTISLFCRKITDFAKMNFVKQVDFILWHSSSELRKGILLENQSLKYK